MKIRVLVVDDHAAMREGISAILNAQPDMIVAGEAGDGREAIVQFKALRPDVSLVDWNLPIISGEEVLDLLGAEFPDARFIVITALDGEESVRRALKLGAKSYLWKDMLRRELLPAIRAVHEGKQYFPDRITGQIKKPH
jgi:DNA-binding NarL/FixJ family response regulator